MGKNIFGIGKIQRQRDGVAKQPRGRATELWGPTKVMSSVFRGNCLVGALQINSKRESTIPGGGEKCLKVHDSDSTSSPFIAVRM